VAEPGGLSRLLAELRLLLGHRLGHLFDRNGDGDRDQPRDGPDQDEIGEREAGRHAVVPEPLDAVAHRGRG
jgi:hypothetical protein